MRVSWRHMLAAASLASLAGASVPAVGQACCTPPPSPPPPPPSCGCTPPTNLIITVPGASVAAANVNVAASASAIAVAGVTTTLASGIVVSGGGSSSTIIYGRGGGFFAPAPSVGGAITGLNVEGGYETKTVEETVPVTEDYCIDKVKQELAKRPVEAMCIDDQGAPHPASRLDDAADVRPEYSGEVFRCVAGSHMQVTIGQMVEGKPSFDSGGETFSCAKGEALWHTPAGKLACKIQAPERNCNERSLLRRYGPGVKMVDMSTPKPYCEPAQRTKLTTVSKQVKVPHPIQAGDLALDGGVGSGVQ